MSSSSSVIESRKTAGRASGGGEERRQAAHVAHGLFLQAIDAAVDQEIAGRTLIAQRGQHLEQALAPHDDHVDGASLVLLLVGELQRGADDVGVQRAAQTSVGRQHHDADALDWLGAIDGRVLQPDPLGHRRQGQTG